MSDYKETLNLPQTDFPMKANLPQREPERLQFWSEINLYQQMRDNAKGRPKFILHDGPPYANGKTHLGHSVNKTLKDIVVKFKTLSGFDAPYVPGWDCHGLPIELNVEKKIGKAGVKVSPADFRKACREYAQSQIDVQREEFKRLGVTGDWDNPYKTMNASYEANIIRSLAKIIENGHLSHGRKPVHWCVDCGSALAEAEVEYKDKVSPAIDVRFRVVSESSLDPDVIENLPDNGTVTVPIWTTTPWTLPANQAVAVNPTHTYVLVRIDGGAECLVLAQELLEQAMARFGFEQHQVIASFPGKTLESVLLQHPFLEREVPIVLGDHVTLDAGTGCVHTAPAHGQDDYMIAQHYNIPLHNPVDNRGCFHDDVEYFAGQHVFKANDKVIELLEARGNLLHSENFSHSYPHCWRHKTPLIFRATPQWFISMEKAGLRDDALKAIEESDWFPEWGEERINDMISKRPDWCISRQRFWGTPIPLLVKEKTAELHPNTLDIMEQVAQRIEQEGIEAWENIDITEFTQDPDYIKVMDTLDVWFDSGVSHACVLERTAGLESPAGLYLEGSDQHRGWFQTSLLSSVAMHKRAPYHAVLTHGFTVDDKGHKMSKSLGNVIAPDQVINKLGADTLRLWVASTDYRGELSYSDEIVKRISDAYRRIRNTARFLLSNLHDFDPNKDLLKPKKLLALDAWAVDTAARFQKEICQEYEQYQFHLVVKKIHHFCSIEMGGFYLDILKDRLYTMAPESHGRRSAQSAMYHILQALVRWLAPILSFTAEEIWQHMPGEHALSVFLSQWYEDLAEIDQKERERWRSLMTVRDDVNKVLEEARNQGEIGSALGAKVTLFAGPELLDLLAGLEDELRFVLITSEAQVKPLEEKGEAQATGMDTLYVTVQKSEHEKCERCWHRRSDIGSDAAHPNICGRCVENVAGDGEERKFA